MSSTTPAEKQGSELAKSLRGKWCIDSSTPVENIFNLLADHDVDAVRWPLRSDLDGFLAAVPDVGKVIFVNSNKNKTRGEKSVTVAHELCHIKSGGPEAAVHWENRGEAEKHAAEKRADAFAAQFLLPRAAVTTVIEELEIESGSWTADKIIRLQMKLNVSYRAALERLSSFGLVSKRNYEKLKQTQPVSRAYEMGYDATDIYGRRGLVLPRKFRKLAIAALKNQLIGKKKFQSLMNFTDEELIEKLNQMNLLENYGAPGG